MSFIQLLNQKNIYCVKIQTRQWQWTILDIQNKLSIRLHISIWTPKLAQCAVQPSVQGAECPMIVKCLVPLVPKCGCTHQDLQIVVHPGNLVSRKNLSSKKMLRKIHALFVDNNCFSKTFFNIQNFLWRLGQANYIPCLSSAWICRRRGEGY